VNVELEMPNCNCKMIGNILVTFYTVPKFCHWLIIINIFQVIEHYILSQKEFKIF